MRPNQHLEKEAQADRGKDSEANISKIGINGTGWPFGTVPIRGTNKELVCAQEFSEDRLMVVNKTTYSNRGYNYYVSKIECIYFTLCNDGNFKIKFFHLIICDHEGHVFGQYGRQFYGCKACLNIWSLRLERHFSSPTQLILQIIQIFSK